VGRVKRLTNGSLRHEYNLTDHLGNARVFFADTNSDGTAEILQESHYYAFGMRIEGLGTQSDNKFLYNGKELTDDFGLNWYEYGWRIYDAQLGRWHQVDPMDEFMSPYCFVGNDPINFIDPDGSQSGNATLVHDHFTYDNHGATGVMTWQEPPTFWQSIGNFFSNLASQLSYGGSVNNSHIERAMFQYTPDEVADITGKHLKVAEFAANTVVGAAGGEALTLLTMGGRAVSTGRVFWSGKQLASDAAQNFAKANGKITLEMTFKGRMLTKLTDLTSYKLTAPLWRNASASFAKGASGTVHVFHNGTLGVGVNSIWRTVEYPILNKNNVNIIYHTVFK
jgi:RHS repeat-associated protein